MRYKLTYSRQSERDARELEQCEFDEKAKALLSIFSRNPFQTPRRMRH